MPSRRPGRAPAGVGRPRGRRRSASTPRARRVADERLQVDEAAHRRALEDVDSSAVGVDAEVVGEAARSGEHLQCAGAVAVLGEDSSATDGAPAPASYGARSRSSRAASSRANARSSSVATSAARSWRARSRTSVATLTSEYIGPLRRQVPRRERVILIVRMMPARARSPMPTASSPTFTPPPLVPPVFGAFFSWTSA